MSAVENTNLISQAVGSVTAGPPLALVWLSMIQIAILALVLWAGYTIVKKGGGWAVAGIIAAFLLIVPVVLILFALVGYRSMEVVPGQMEVVPGPGSPAAQKHEYQRLAVRVEQQHAEAVRVIRDSRAEIERTRQEYRVALDMDRDAAAVVRLQLDPAALQQHNVSTGQLAEAVATLAELVALGDGDEPIELSQLRRIRLVGSDDDPLPLAAVLDDLSRSTNLQANDKGPRVIRIVASSSADTGAANADDLAAELVWFDELVESMIQGTFTQEVTGNTVRLQVYQRESLTDQEQQLADAASAQILATLLPEETVDDVVTDREFASEDDVTAVLVATTDEDVVIEEEEKEDVEVDDVAADGDAAVDEDVATNEEEVSTGNSDDAEVTAAVVSDDVSAEDDDVEDLAAAVAATRVPEPFVPPSVAVPYVPVPPVAAVAPVAPLASDEPVELTLPVEVDTSPERPDWVDDEDELKNDGVYRATVAAGPYETRLECERALNNEIFRATAEYLQHLQPWVGNVDALDRNYLRSNLVKAVWEERHDTSVGPMRTIHARLEYTPDVQHHLQAVTRERIVNERLAMTGVLSGIVLAVLGTLFGYFKIDTLTKGYYSTRLKLLTGAVILGMLGTLVSLFG